jgi:hypothetical protein
MLTRFVPIAVLFLLLSCGTVPVAEQPTAVPAMALPPTATPTLTDIAATLKEQLISDKILVQSITVEEGALPTLTITYNLGAGATGVDVLPQIERAIYTVSKRIAALVQSGVPIDRAVLVLMLDEKTKVGSTSINTRDMVAWSKGDLTDQQFQARWSQVTN